MTGHHQVSSRNLESLPASQGQRSQYPESKARISRIKSIRWQPAHLMPNLDEQYVAKAITQHLQHPEIPTDTYVKHKIIALGISLSSLIKVYLDQRFWILLRDVHIGRSTRPDVRRLLDALRLSVQKGCLICPISDSVFLELLKQEDISTRRSTAELIDELSLGITLVPNQQRAGQELVGVFAKFAEYGREFHVVDHLVWSKLGYVLGIVHPSLPWSDPDTERAAQKAFFDLMWDFPLATQIDTVGQDGYQKPESFEATANRINELNREHQAEVRDFRRVYIDEFRGVLKLCMHHPRQWIEQQYELKTGKKCLSSPEEISKYEHELYTFFGNLIAHRKEAALLLPTLHISALCYSAIRWDKKRNLSANDIYDFQHAAAAIGYCDAFLTEKPLMNLLAQRHLAINTDFQCTVISDIEEANQWISSKSAMSAMG